MNRNDSPYEPGPGGRGALASCCCPRAAAPTTPGPAIGRQRRCQRRRARLVRAQGDRPRPADGFGGNSWRLVTTAAGKDEAAKCPSVTNFRYADGQGNTQKAISDIQGMVATGCRRHGGLPRRGQGGAARAAQRLRGRRGHRALPGRPGRRGRRELRRVDRRRLRQRRQATGARGSRRTCPTAATSSSSAARRATARASTEYEGLHKVLDRTTTTSSSASSRSSSPTGTRPLTQQVLTADIAKYPKIDVIVSDFGPSLVGALPVFEKSGRLDPRARHLRRQRPDLLLGGQQGHQPRSRCSRSPPATTTSRLAVQYAVARATGGEIPDRRRRSRRRFSRTRSPATQPGQCDATTCPATSTCPPRCPARSRRRS